MLPAHLEVGSSTASNRKPLRIGSTIARVAMLSALIVVGAGTPSRAQDPGKEAPKTEVPAEPAKAAEPAPAVDAPADPAAAAPAPAGEATPAAEPPKPEVKTFLQLAWESSGIIGLFLVALSVYFTAIVIKLFLELRLSEAVPVPLVEKLETAIKERKFQEAYDVCKDNESFLARMVRTGIANLPNGRSEAKDSMLNVQEEIVTTMETKISYLAIVGTLGPMIGLVGTIAGMIDSFSVIATAGGQPSPQLVARGISQALFITLEGIALSIPAIFFFAFFRNRIALMSMEAAKVADRTINSLVNAAKASKSAGTAAG
ncbi:MAG: MotA/TolQ/ExbB proton channel family protein [Isosphaeraceae bacterium]|nr:MotA/TolQ/ExbB proton channel family protein [Isosphaeraceae bacterium]